ncbi:MAG: SRPBCC family protein [Ardenticatenales bacterium]|nr:SRPBCC family protein [Ardenticatenales bacterium]
MPPSATVSKLIRVAPGSIWQSWSDLPQWPRWHPETIEATWLEGEPWADGSRFGLLRRTPYPWLEKVPGVGARRFMGIVRSAVSEQLLVWELTPTSAAWLGPTLVESVRLIPAPGGTTVALTLSTYGLLPSLLFPILPPLLRAQASKTLDALHHKLSPIERRL